MIFALIWSHLAPGHRSLRAIAPKDLPKETAVPTAIPILGPALVCSPPLAAVVDARPCSSAFLAAGRPVDKSGPFCTSLISKSLLTTTQSSRIIEHMSDNNGAQAETTTEERKPPTLADIVREKTDDGARIIDFFLDVMEDRVEGADLCHRMDAAKELKKHKSGAAARFIDRYSGVPCRHILRRRPRDPNHSDGADPAPSVEVPAPFSNNLLSVLSAVDEHLMTMLVRAQTAHGDTIVEFLDDVMQNRIDGFKCHHRIAAAKELIVHIVRDEQPEPVPGSAPRRTEAQDEPEWMSWPWDYRHARRFSLESPREALAKAEADPDHPLHEYFTSDSDVRESLGSVGGVIGPDGLLTSRARTHPVHPVPAEGSKLGTNNSKRETLPVRTRTRRTRKQRRQAGDARAAIRRKALESERIEEGKDEKPAPVDLTPAERRIREKLKAHWHEPGPWDGPIDSAHPGRSPPW